MHIIHIVHPSIVEHPVTIQSVYPGEIVNFSCRAEGFSILSYSWFKVESDNVEEVENSTNPTYIILNPTYNQNNADYYCVATNNEGTAVSNFSTLRGTYTQYIVCSLNCAGVYA